MARWGKDRTDRRMNTYDHIIVGSGINALVAAAMLGKRGRKVLVLERNDRIGGCIRTEEITAPGFVHDVMATTFVLFITSPAYAALAKDLGARGLQFSHSPTPTGVLTPDGRSVVFRMDRAANIATFDALAAGDGAAYARDLDRMGGDLPLIFSLLGGQLWSRDTLKLVGKEAWRRGLRPFAAFFGEALATARGWLEQGYASPMFHALFAPWVLHCGLGPESAYSAQMAKVIAFAVEAAGCPIVTGGAQNLLNAFEKLITDQGGEIRTGADVASILRDRTGKAAAQGVLLADGSKIFARLGVIASVTPTQLYNRLLAGTHVPQEVSDGVRGYRYGKGNMQIHYALSAPPQWPSADLGNVALLHLTPGLDGVSRAANECERGMLPAVPTICVGQPASLDPSRCPPGQSILWLQLPETPRHIKGDAAGQLEVPADGQWTEALREAYAGRVEAILASHIPNFRQTVLARRCYSPADLAAMNMNLVGGDPYGGYCGLDQFFIWRPLKGSSNHATHVPKLYHIGASTHPGPGLGGMSGFLLAKAIG